MIVIEFLQCGDHSFVTVIIDSYYGLLAFFCKAKSLCPCVFRSGVFCQLSSIDKFCKHPADAGLFEPQNLHQLGCRQ